MLWGFFCNFPYSLHLFSRFSSESYPKIGLNQECHIRLFIGKFTSIDHLVLRLFPALDVSGYLYENGNMKTSLNRRDFLKVTGLLSMSAVFSPHSWQATQPQVNRDQPNILILIFDAWSSFNTSLYGYQRQTTPYLERLAE